MTARFLDPRFGDVERRRIDMPPAADVRMRLNRLERVTPWPESIRSKIAEAIAASSIEQYPDYRAFHEKLGSSFYDVTSAQMVMGAGIEDFIRTLMASCSGRRAMTLWPTCAMHQVYADAFGVELIKAPTRPDKDDPAVADICTAIRGARPDVFFLANPGQPVPTYYDMDQLFDIADACRSVGCVLAIDEAYNGFDSVHASPLIGRFENVVVLRTFSKAMGAASIRLGVALSGPLIRSALDAVRPSGEITGPTMAIASVLMDHIDDIAAEANRVIEGRKWLAHCFREFGVTVRTGPVNYVLIRCDAQAVAARLAERGVLVRVAFPDWIMVTAGPVDMMLTFADEFLHAVEPPVATMGCS